MWRSMLNFTASALNGSPSWNFTPGRSLMTTERWSARPLVAGGELGHDLEIGRDVEELVADRGEDEAAGVGAADRGVERVGIVVEADAQDALRGGGAGGEHHDRDQREQAACQAHEGSSL